MGVKMYVCSRHLYSGPWIAGGHALSRRCVLEEKSITYTILGALARGVATGGGISVYIPPPQKNQSTKEILYGISSPVTQDNLDRCDIVPLCTPVKIYTPK